MPTNRGENSQFISPTFPTSKRKNARGAPKSSGPQYTKSKPLIAHTFKRKK